MSETKQNVFDLEGQCCIVTGANGAIGSAIVDRLTASGAKVFVTSSKNSDLESMASKNSNIFGFLSIDLSSEQSCKEVLESALKASPTQKIDILVNCAGIAIDNLFLRITEDEWDKQVDVNLKYLWKLTQLTAIHMSRQKYGRIVSISSVIGHLGNVGQIVYSVTKSALFGMTKSLARELAKRNITVNTVSPGFIQSPMTDKLLNDPAMYQSILSTIPVGEIGTPDDVAFAVLYLVSKEAKYVTGTDICVSGGMYMG